MDKMIKIRRWIDQMAKYNFSPLNYFNAQMEDDDERPAHWECEQLKQTKEKKNVAPKSAKERNEEEKKNGLCWFNMQTQHKIS